MSLDRLRTYRTALRGEESSASYWHTLLQARRDVLRVGDRSGDRVALRDALTQSRALAGGNGAILAQHPPQGIPILPRLHQLWTAEMPPTAGVQARAFTARLTSAESVLSSYCAALRRRLDRATADLVARYHEDPRQCLAVLPKVG